MNRILITGGTGFLGKHLQLEFKKEEKDNEILYLGNNGGKNNLVICENAERIIKDFRPDIIIHCAAVCGGILANKNNPGKFLYDNLMMGLNVYESGRKYNVQYIYSLGSVCSYPKICSVPFKEEDFWKGYPEETNAPYGFAKKGLYMLSKTYREQYGIKGAHLLVVNLFGTHDHFDLQNSHVIPALINKFVNAKRSNLKQVECWGTGTITREFLYAGDAARAIHMAVNNKLDYSLPINIGTGKDISIKELASMISTLVGYNGDIVFNGAVSDGQPKRMLDCSKAKKILGFESQITLIEGLKKTINWYEVNYGQ